MPDQVTILLVEDNDGDARLVQEGFERIKERQVRVARSGGDARRYLERCGTPQDPEPGLVLIDLGLPDISGHDLIQWIRGRPRLRHIPVVVLTASENAADRVLSYEFGANAHVVKPVQLDSLVDVVNTLDRFWVQLVSGPRAREGELKGGE